jgi:hypothetical protein
MGFLDGVRDLFPHTVTLAPWTGQNQYGEATYGDDSTYQAKIEQGVDLLRAGIGDRSIVPKYKVFVAEPIQVDLRDRLALDAVFGERDESGTFVAPTAVIMKVAPVYDEREWVCTILYCG